MKLLDRSRAAIPCVSLIIIFSVAVSIRAQESMKVVGSVADPNSAPIPGAHISLFSFERILQTTSDSSGHFRFDAVPIGKYEFEVMATGFKRTVSNVDVTDLMRTGMQDKPMELTVVMQIGPTGSPMEIIPATEVALSGSCGPPDSVTYRPRKTGDADALNGIVINRYPKEPVARATLQLIDAAGAPIAQQQTNERGEFQFKQTAPGRYRILFQHPGYNNTKSFEFWVARENATYITMQAVRLGKVIVCQ